MKAIILAAGKGSRLYPLTLKKPKGLLEVNNYTIVGRLISQFKAIGINDIVLVIGYQGKEYKNFFGDSVRYVYYPHYELSNNLNTLWHIRDELCDDVIISFSDLYLDSNITKELIKHPGDFVFATDNKTVLDGTMRVKVRGDQVKSITSTSKSEATGNFLGISKISTQGCQFLINAMEEISKDFNQLYYTIAIDNLIKEGLYVFSLECMDMKWIEIDTNEEYQYLSKNFKLFT